MSNVRDSGKSGLKAASQTEDSTTPFYPKLCLTGSTLHIYVIIRLPCLHEFKRSSFTQVFALVGVFSATCVYSCFHASSFKRKVYLHMKVFAFIVKTDTCKRGLSDSNSLRIRLERTVIASAKAIPNGWTLSSQHVALLLPSFLSF